MTAPISAPPARLDGRADDELRPITITRGWLDHAAGSVLVEFGRTRVLGAARASVRVARRAKAHRLGRASGFRAGARTAGWAGSRPSTRCCRARRTPGPTASRSGAASVGALTR